MNEKLLRGEEVAEILGVSKAYAYRLLATGELPIVKLGRGVRVKPCDLEVFINHHLQNISAPSIEIDKGDFDNNLTEPSESLAKPTC